MRILIVSNPRAGRGKGARTVEALRTRLTRASHAVTIVTAGDALPTEPAPDLLIAAGGDGTLHHQLPYLLTTSTPLFHLPMGTENLFPREFGATAAVDSLVAAINAPRFRAVDVGVCNDIPFAIMASVGPDANVIHRLNQTRRGVISHLAYARPCLAEAVDPGIPRLSLLADGALRVRARRGVIIVANSRQYAFRIDPCPDARIDDGALDAVFLPCDSAADVVMWSARCRLRTHLDDPRVVSIRAQHLEIETELIDPPFQMDGEAHGSYPPRRAPPDAGDPLHLSVMPRALRVLLPPDHH